MKWPGDFAQGIGNCGESGQTSHYPVVDGVPGTALDTRLNPSHYMYVSRTIKYPLKFFYRKP